MSQRKAALVATLEVATIIEYLEMFSLNSCKNARKLTGISEMSLCLQHKVFKKPKF